MNQRPVLCLPVLILMITFAQSSWAQAPERLFQVMGVISNLGPQTITVIDNKIRLSPTVKVVSATGNKASLESLRPGTRVGLDLTRIGKTRYVDTIHVLK